MSDRSLASLHEALGCEFTAWNECYVHDQLHRPEGFGSPTCPVVDKVMAWLADGQS